MWNGRRATIRDHAKTTGIKEQTIYARLKRGWSVADTMTRPLVASSESKGMLRHGHASRGRPSGAWRTWRGLFTRCTNRKDPGWKNYGGRGITVCERWRVFENFLADMGERPAGASIDRINNDGNYEPGNCRWATRIEQNSNTRVAKHLTMNGETRTLSGWARVVGIGAPTIHHRLKVGWSVERALTTPPTGRGRRR